jgi:hypothetical protein
LSSGGGSSGPAAAAEGVPGTKGPGLVSGGGGHAVSAASGAAAAAAFLPTRAFHDMLTRQAQHLARAAENARRVASQATPSFQPSLNAKSLHLVAESGRGSFEQRLAVNVLERGRLASQERPGPSSSRPRGPGASSNPRDGDLRSSSSSSSVYGAWPAGALQPTEFDEDGQPIYEPPSYEQENRSLLYGYPEPPSQVKGLFLKQNT